ncbi:sensor histidine kinase [Rathayibacter sp. AY1A5]|uniref:sensor histidine kinase n=1 Tax=Rathayibacter sp. AY1A5 TaxID=2080523 RepID=UPI0021578D30|nr:histidine kinase [Rathayibacter sp. AY1A5]
MVGTTRWTSDVRTLPGGWITRSLLLGSFTLLVVIDLMGGSVDLTSVRGWIELALPYLPLLALLAGAIPAAVSLYLVYAVVLMLGAPPLLLAALIFPTIVVVGFVTFLLPWRAGLVFVLGTLVLLPAVLLVDRAMGTAVYVLGAFVLFGGTAGLGLNAFRGRSERSERRADRIQEEQARIRNEERTRLAHELHDIVAHEVTIIAMQARRATSVEDPAKTERILESIGDAAQQALQDLRSLVTLLQDEDEAGAPARGDSDLLGTPEVSGATTTAVGFVHDVRNVADAIERAGFRVRLDVAGSVAQVPASLRQVLRRTVRELGTNVLKHGDTAGEVQLRLEVSGGEVQLSSSNAIASAAPIVSSHLGIEAMSARCAVFGGRLDAGARGGRWTTTMTIPLEGRASGALVAGATDEGRER